MTDRKPCFVIRLFSSDGFVRRPAPERIALDGAENTLPHAGIGVLQRAQQLLDFLALGAAVHRTGIVHNGQLQPLGKRADVGLRRVYHRADDRHTGAIQIGHRQKAAESAFVQQRHEHGLNHIVKMMAERDLVAAVCLGGAVERAAAHVRAQRARVFLLADVKHDGLDVGLLRDKFHTQLLAQRRNRREIHLVIAHLQRDGLDLEFLGVEAAQPCERRQQRQRVLAAGHADRNDVAFFYHMVLIHRTADIREHFLHGFPPKRAFFAP